MSGEVIVEEPDVIRVVGGERGYSAARSYNPSAVYDSEEVIQEYRPLQGRSYGSSYGSRSYGRSYARPTYSTEALHAVEPVRYVEPTRYAEPVRYSAPSPVRYTSSAPVYTGGRVLEPIRTVTSSIAEPTEDWVVVNQNEAPRFPFVLLSVHPDTVLRRVTMSVLPSPLQL